jgi:pyruvate,water dikinase
MNAALTTIPERIGAKAESLDWLRRHGFPVPEWTVVPARFLEEFLAYHGLRRPPVAAAAGRAALQRSLLECPWPPLLAHELRELTNGLLAHGPVAARSSGTLEDLADASFAGQYESVLNLADFAALQRGVRTCWSSAFSERVFEYCAHRNLDTAELTMAVIVQRMVPATAAGVAFSVNPVTGADDEVLIEACAGLGEALVAGHVDPERIRFAWIQGCERERTPAAAGAPVLTPTQAARIAEITVKAQALRGHPVDLEWALAGEDLWLVQSRPVTGIGFSAYPGEWTTADFKDGGVSAGVCTPFMASVYREAFVGSLPSYLDGVGLTARGAENQPWYRVIFGRPYWNAGLTKGRLAQLPGFKERGFDESLGIRPGYAGDGMVTRLTLRSLLHGLRALRRMRRSFRERLARSGNEAQELVEIMDEWQRADPAALGDAALGEAWSRLLRRDYLRCERFYFTTIYDNSNAQTLFQERLSGMQRTCGGDLGCEPLALLGGLCDISHLRPARDEDRLLDALRADPAAARALLAADLEDLCAWHHTGGKYPGSGPIRTYLERWGWMTTRTLEILAPRWSENPAPVFESLRRALATEDHTLRRSAEEAEEAQRVAFANARERCLSLLRSRVPGVAVLRRRAFLRDLQVTRSLLWWREEMRAHSTRMYSLVRSWTLELGRRLVTRSWLDAPEDVFFLECGQIQAVTQRSATREQVRAWISVNRRYTDGFRAFRNPPEIGARWLAGEPMPEAAAPGALLQGIGGSSGRLQGVARVILSVDEVARLRPGEVLVTRFTDPGWTSAFAGLGAVVTETGGVLSHAAVISREYGLPAVLAVPDATTRIRDGAQIFVDGDAGTVLLLQPA